MAHKWLWWRHSWFYNWAHKPLCEHYREDVLRIGQLRLCRGCTVLWSGLLVGGPVLAWQISASALPILFMTLIATVTTLSHPALHSRWPRPVRDFLRFSAGTLLPLSIALTFAGQVEIGLGALAGLAGIYVFYARIRGRWRLQKCETCEELDTGICSGYVLQAEAIRAWEEQASRREMVRRVKAGF